MKDRRENLKVFVLWENCIMLSAVAVFSQSILTNPNYKLVRPCSAILFVKLKSYLEIGEQSFLPGQLAFL